MNKKESEDPRQRAFVMLYDLLTEHDENGVWSHDVHELIDHIVEAAVAEMAKKLTKSLQ